MAPTSVDLPQLIQSSRKDCRVDVVSIAKKLGLEVYSVIMSSGRSGDIRYDRDANKAYIEVNRAHPVTRQRFTVAHEISHFIHHQDKLVEKGQLDRNNEFKDAQEIALEHKADKEAAEILMPESIVEEYFSKKKWNKNTKFTADMIDDIAEQFWVSRAMAVTRLRELDFPVPYLSFA